MQANAIADSTTQNEEQPRESRPARTVSFQDSHDELVQSSSRDEPPKTEPARVVGYHRDPQMQERQREQQKAGKKAASTVIDLREKINAGKRAREEAEQLSSTTTPTPVAHAASPTQPEARRQRLTRGLLTSAEIQSPEKTQCVSNAKCQLPSYRKTHSDRNSRLPREEGTQPRRKESRKPQKGGHKTTARGGCNVSHRHVKIPMKNSKMCDNKIVQKKMAEQAGEGK